jgi:hypothetical protein
MNSSTTTLVVVWGLLSQAVSAGLWFGFMAWKPRQWEAFVDWEYAFWVRRGVISSAFAEKCKRLEKGAAFRRLVGGAALVGTIFFLVAGFLWLKS